MEFPDLPQEAPQGVQYFVEELEEDFELEQEARTFDWIVETVEAEQKRVHTISYIFCNDDFLYEMNVEHLQHDDLTDVITFPYQSDPIEGEVYISIDRIKENAEKYNITWQHELRRVMVHGALHLCGYTDKTEADRTAMTGKENFYLARF
jgi:probable rRNA maturation factor